MASTLSGRDLSHSRCCSSDWRSSCRASCPTVQHCLLSSCATTTCPRTARPTHTIKCAGGHLPHFDVPPSSQNTDDCSREISAMKKQARRLSEHTKNQRAFASTWALLGRGGARGHHAACIHIREYARSFKNIDTQCTRFQIHKCTYVSFPLIPQLYTHTSIMVSSAGTLTCSLPNLNLNGFPRHRDESN